MPRERLCNGHGRRLWDGRVHQTVMEHWIDDIANSSFTPHDDLRVVRHGDVAWTTLTFHLSAVLKDGGGLVLDGRHTAIWERRDGRWLIVHEHLSVPLPS